MPKVPIGTSEIKAGMIVEFRYTKLDGTNDLYSVLVIDPSKPSKPSDTSSEFYLHGFSLKDIADNDLKEFISDISRFKLDTDEAYKNFAGSKYVDSRPYRTFRVNNISSVTQVKAEE